MTDEEAKEAIELPFSGDAAFGALMDALAPEPDDASTGAGDATDAAAAGADGSPAAPVEGAGAAGAVAGAPADGGAGDPVVPDAGATGGTGTAADGSGADEPAAGDAATGVGPVDFNEIRDAFGEISTALEETTLKVHQTAAVEEVRKEFPKYFEALQRHPRMLVGVEVPSLTGEGTERLKDSADATDWQEAVKALLSEEVRERSLKAAEGDDATLSTLHSSIELFQNNSDLVPGTKQFDKELADQFAKLVKPYEVRIDEKLIGFNIPVQPLIDMVRGQLKETRAKAAEPPAVPAPAVQQPQGKPAAPAKTPAPQKAVQSKAGTSSEPEDFSTLFGTLGPGFSELRI